MFRSGIELELLANAKVADFNALARAHQREAAISQSVTRSGSMTVIGNIRHRLGMTLIGVGARLAHLHSPGATITLVAEQGATSSSS